ncbi:hypothetical protein KXD40_001687 [Peronospora effusa]|nr:hypothetical protein KXD40_001687 [Peronospora effusa]
MDKWITAVTDIYALFLLHLRGRLFGRFATGILPSEKRFRESGDNSTLFNSCAMDAVRLKTPGVHATYIFE